jgi:hypothetical protein
MATVTGLIAALLGLIVAASAAIDYLFLEARIKGAVKKANAATVKQFQTAVSAAIEAATSYGYALSQQASAEDLEEVARNAIRLYPDLRNALLTTAARYIDEVSLGSTLSQGYPKPLAEWESQIRSTLSLLDEAESRATAEDRQLAAFLRAKCHAMLREPVAALRNFSIAMLQDAGKTIRTLRSDRYFYYFVGMSPSDATLVLEMFAPLYGSLYPFSVSGLSRYLSGSLIAHRLVVARDNATGLPLQLSVHKLDELQEPDASKTWIASSRPLGYELGWIGQPASKRFSSFEAAVDWIAQGPHTPVALVAELGNLDLSIS